MGYTWNGPAWRGGTAGKPSALVARVRGRASAG